MIQWERQNLRVVQNLMIQWELSINYKIKMAPDLTRSKWHQISLRLALSPFMAASLLLTFIGR
jgi:hypothetical protein